MVPEQSVARMLCVHLEVGRKPLATIDQGSGPWCFEAFMTKTEEEGDFLWDSRAMVQKSRFVHVLNRYTGRKHFPRK